MMQDLPSEIKTCVLGALCSTIAGCEDVEAKWAMQELFAHLLHFAAVSREFRDLVAYVLRWHADGGCRVLSPVVATHPSVLVREFLPNAHVVARALLQYANANVRGTPVVTCARCLQSSSGACSHDAHELQTCYVNMGAHRRRLNNHVVHCGNAQAFRQYYGGADWTRFVRGAQGLVRRLYPPVVMVSLANQARTVAV